MNTASAYEPQFAVIAERLCRVFGATDEQLAVTLDVTRETIVAWRGAYPEFNRACEAGKAYADEQVEQALYKRAVGASHEETKWFQHEGQSWSESYTKHYPPDTGACMAWLNNRRRDRWSRNPLEISLTKPITLSYALPTEAPNDSRLKIVGATVIDIHRAPQKAVDE